MTRNHLSRLRLLAVFVAAAAVLAVPASAFGGVSLAGWWPLAEGSGQIAHDISGHGNHGTLGSTPGVDDNDPTWVKGIFWGSALSFDGNDYVQLPASPALQPQHLTISLWFRGAGSPGPYRYLIGKGGDGCVSSSWALTTSFNGGLIFYVWNGTEQRDTTVPAPATVWDGRWHHAAGTFDGTNVKLFVDGKLIGSSSIPTTIDYNLPAQGSMLGGYPGSCQLTMTGALDQVSLWTEALPIDQIWQRFGWFLGQPLTQ
jgi:hypothetical protein